jgi:hypothetical protein
MARQGFVSFRQSQAQSTEGAEANPSVAATPQSSLILCSSFMRTASRFEPVPEPETIRPSLTGSEGIDNCHN